MASPQLISSLAPSHSLALNKHGTLVNKICFGETKVEINRSSTLVALFTPGTRSKEHKTLQGIQLLCYLKEVLL